jgi:hypothetical protein
MPGLRREDFPVPDRLTYLNRAALTGLLDFPGHPAELGSAADSLGARPARKFKTPAPARGRLDASGVCRLIPLLLRQERERWRPSARR